MTNDMTLLLFRVLLVAGFPASAYFKIIEWPAMTAALERAAIPYPYQFGMIATLAELLLPFFIVLGIATGWAASGLLLHVIAVTYVDHAFWQAPPEEFRAQLIAFLSSFAVMGGLILLAVLGPGRFALQRQGEVAASRSDAPPGDQPIAARNS